LVAIIVNGLEHTAWLWRHEIDHCDRQCITRQAGARQLRPPLMHRQTDRQAPYLLKNRHPPLHRSKKPTPQMSITLPLSGSKKHRRGRATHHAPESTTFD